ncbi:MAG: tetratricopeptide repeat protein [bacterium]
MRILAGFLVLLLAAIAVAHADLEEQIEALTAQIEHEGESAALYLRRGEVNRLHEDWDAALTDYARAQQLDPELREVEFARGRMYLEAGRLEEAKAALDQFLANNPQHEGARLTRARLLAQMGQPLLAADEYTSAIALMSEPRPEHYIERARARASAGEEHLHEAVRGLDEGCAKLGPVVTLRLVAAELEAKAGHYDHAEARVKDIMGNSPRKDIYHVQLGDLYEEWGKPEMAKEAYAKAVAEIEALPEKQRETRFSQDLEKRAGKQF